LEECRRSNSLKYLGSVDLEVSTIEFDLDHFLQFPKFFHPSQFQEPDHRQYQFLTAEGVDAGWVVINFDLPSGLKPWAELSNLYSSLISSSSA
jgi:hypothetical protein